MRSVLSLSQSQRRELFVAAAQETGIGEVIIEKDFWVCWTLRTIFGLPNIGEHIIFKGGTSLSKVWKAIDRFSEDIDISISRAWLGFEGDDDPEGDVSNNERKRRLDRLSASCADAVRTKLLPLLEKGVEDTLGAKGWRLEIDPNDPQTILFEYPTALQEQTMPYIGRAVKIEGGARSDHWPAQSKSIRPYVAEAYPGQINDSEVQVKVLGLERTFWEKATILHADAHEPAETKHKSKYSRHFADLAAMADLDLGKEALKQLDLLERVVEHKKAYFQSNKARYDLAVPGSFKLLSENSRLEGYAQDYKEMRVMYFGEPRPWGEVIERLRRLESEINSLT